MRVCFVLILLSLSVMGYDASGQDQGINTHETLQEYQIKAAFLQNFSFFIYWPSQPSATASPKRILCVLGENPFARALDLVVEEFNKDTTEQHEVRYLQRVEDVHECRILYISDSEQHRLRMILDYIHGFPMLSVSSLENFAHQGGIVEFYRQGDKIRFYINLDNLNAAGLKANANLLRIGTIITENASQDTK